MLKNIRIVLVGTSHPGNIGAAARAMKTMGLSQLYLVEPKHFPADEAYSRASGAGDLLDAAVVCSSLDEALSGCVLVAGSSARPRRIGWPLLAPRDCAQQLVGEGQAAPVALVFGRERSGLSNDELDRCHIHVRIPTNPDFSSLNIAAAVQVLAYEMQVAGLAPEPEPESESESAAKVAVIDSGEGSDDAASYASADDMELFYQHLEQVLIETDFLDPAKPRHLMRRLRRMYGRIRPDNNEYNILRGMLTAVQTSVNKK